MNVCIIFAAIFTVIQALPLSDLEEQQWKEFTLTYEKQYENEKEEIKRKEIFAQNLHKFAEHNKKYASGLVSYTIGVNQFADMTDAEFLKTLTPMNVSAVTGGLPYVPSEVEAPASIDWRQKGAVTPVRHQKQCGSCYTFSATGALEGQFFMKRGRLIKLSEQNLLDCSSKHGNNGCNGGFPSNCFKYVKDNNGIDTEQSYPYEAVVGECRYDPKNSAGRNTGFSQLPKGDEVALTNAVGTIGPISIALNGAPIRDYTGGIFDDICNPSQINHAVLAVGYGTSSDGKPYWIVKNSWGAGYGEQGYIRLARNKNTCGLTALSTYPVV